MGSPGTTREAKKRLHYYARKWLDTNTHSLRYALVGYLTKKGVAAQIIAKITGHKSWTGSCSIPS